ncbi:MAG: cystathionine beta-lyase [Alphaproteobacteria bacterium]|nr:cystathionine beta-lyase [Alphaproteobacteria bacterium]
MKEDTKLIHAGRSQQHRHQIVNPPVYHASTVLFPTMDAIEEAQAARARDERPMVYGLSGTPTTFALEDAVIAAEGGHRAALFPSGLAAIMAALLATVRAGCHILVTDSVYAPTRNLCDHLLKRLGVETTYYDPLIGGGIAELMRPDTAVVFVEAPGSLTFEMQDIPAIAEVAHRHGALVLMDNTWASPLFFKPFEKGVDMSIQAATKYMGGHSDVLLGTVAANRETWPLLRDTQRQLGQNAAPDDCFLVLRGMRTLRIRLERHQANGIRLAEWLRGRPEVARVLHPALPDDPGHGIWKRDFLGATGLFGFELKPGYPRRAVAAMLDGLEHFGMGYSWGGFESLIVPCEPSRIRSATPWRSEGQLLRVHAGLEDVDDLIADLARGFERLSATG